MKSEKLIGIVQPKNKNKIEVEKPELYEIGCLGKITSFKETDDGRYLIDLKGIIRFKILSELKTIEKYRKCAVDYENYFNDLNEKSEDLKFSDLELIFKDLKTLFDKEDLLLIESFRKTKFR